MKPIEFTFEAVNKRGEKHLYGVNLNHALTTGFINKYSAVEIAFGSIRPLDNELDLNEAIYIGTQCEEIRGFFYDLLILAITDDNYMFLLGKEQPFEETVLEGDCLNCLSVCGDGVSYHFKHTFVLGKDRSTFQCEDLVFSSYEEAVRAFIKDFQYINPMNSVYYSPQKALKIYDKLYSTWELPVPINEEL